MPGVGQRGVAHVPAQVEVGVVLPDRAADLAGQVADALAEARDQVEALVDVGEEGLVVGRLALEDRRAADVDVDRALLGVQRGDVGARERLGVAHAASLFQGHPFRVM